MLIGQYTIDNPVFLAPMAGITDLPFRKLCRDFGAGLTTSEMVTSDSSLWHSDKSSHRLQTDAANNSAPISIQIAGSDPSQMAEAAIKCVELGAQIVDINMGCPVKKVCKKLAGSALLQNESLVEEILTETVKAVDVPVTLKTRTGWSTENKNGQQIAKIAEQAGIAALAVHGRTRECRFKGSAEYDSIAKIVDCVSIPVLANGDIDSPSKAKSVLEQTGAAGVMIGRAAYGNPWIFREISRYLKDEQTLARPSLNEQRDVMIEHVSALHEFYGELKGLRIARKHLAWYLNGLPDSKARISAFNRLTDANEQLELIQSYFEWLSIYEEKAA